MADDDLTALALDEARSRLAKAVEVHRRDLQSVRTGRAHPSLVEHLHMDYYGTAMALNQLATVTVPEARLIVIRPWDKNAFDPISKGILQSDLGLNPQSDGVVIRLAIPELTADRRQQLVKQVGQKNEAARVAIRKVRRDVQDELRKMEKAKDLSQDAEHRAHDALEKLTRQFIEQIDTDGTAKEQELLEV